MIAKRLESRSLAAELGVRPTKSELHMTKEVLATSLSVILAISCQTPKAPPPNSAPVAATQDSAIAPYLRSSGIDRPDIYIELRADNTSPVPGDTVHFTLVARNIGPTQSK